MPEPIASRRAGAIDLLRIVRAVAIGYVAVGAVVALRWYAGAKGAPVVWPLVTLVAIFAAFVALLRARQKEPLRFLQIGVFFASFVLLYAAAPLVIYALNGFEFTPLNDPRLYYNGARPEAIGSIAWWYVVFLASFCAAYLYVRPRRHGGAAPVLRTKPDMALMIVIVVAIGTVAIVLLAIQRTYRMQASTYGEGYLAVMQLPLFIAQIYSHLNAHAATLQILGVAALMCHYKRARLLLAVLLLGILITHLISPGARTALFLVFVAAAQTYDFFVKRLSFKVLVAAAAAGFLLFTLLSVLRQSDSEGDRLRQRSSAKEVLLGATEFEAMYGNAYDLKFTLAASRTAVRWPALYFADLTAFLPQQLLPFPKTAPALWYVTTYYPEYAAVGGGLAFGVVPEAMIGFGMIELVWRGALLGAIFGLLHRRLVSRPIPFWFLAMYVWLTVWSFTLIRNTAFSLLAPLVHRYFVPLIAVYLVAAIVRGRGAVGSLGRRVLHLSGARA